MAEQFHVECPDDETATQTEWRFRDLAMDNEPLMAVKREGNNVFAGMSRHRSGRSGSCRDTGAKRRRPARFGDLFY